MVKPKALILGAGGQDGPFLAKHLLNEDFDVTCISSVESIRLNQLKVDTFKLRVGLDSDLLNLFGQLAPDLVINLASKSSVAFCEENPKISEEVNYELVVKIVTALEKFSQTNSKKVKFIQASSSEMYGISNHPCTEETAMNAVTTYGKHKLLAHEFLLDHKSRHNSVNCHSVILFNHESEFRSLNFVSAKIARAAAEVAVNGRTDIEFGNLESSRDWGYADEYMEGVSKIAVSGHDESYLLASGELHSVRELLESAFRVIGSSNFKDFIKTSSAYKRKKETGPIVGDASKVYKEFGWRPSVGYEEMIEILVRYQISQIRMNKP